MVCASSSPTKFYDHLPLYTPRSHLHSLWLAYILLYSDSPPTTCYAFQPHG